MKNTNWKQRNKNTIYIFPKGFQNNWEERTRPSGKKKKNSQKTLILTKFNWRRQNISKTILEKISDLYNNKIYVTFS